MPFHSDDFVKTYHRFGYQPIPRSIKVGRRKSKGIVYELKDEAPVLSIQDGIILRTVNSDSIRSRYGRLIVVEHLNEVKATYYHLDKNIVEEGQLVKQGQTIGFSGNSGMTTVKNGIGIEIYINDSLINPASILQ